MTFDRASGRLEGARLVERCAVLALQTGAKATSPFNHRGYSIGCRLISSVVDKRDIIVRLNEDALFAFPLGDSYWSRLLNRSYTYEEELDRFLSHVASVDYTFLDCGANFGFWSVLVSSRPYGGHQAIAIEASPANAGWLQKNTRLNGNRFEVINLAIGGRTGGTARIHGRKNEALSIMPDAGPARGEEVGIVALDDLLDGRIGPGAKRIVVKLDIEGVEIDAIKGGQRLLAGDVMVICEEHGSDRQHTATRYLMNETPCRVFILNPSSNRFERVIDLTMLDRIKKFSGVGYNVFATASPFWEEQLLSANLR